MEEPYELPEGWVWTRLGGITTLVSGGTPSRIQPKYWKKEIPWVKISDIPEDGIVKKTAEYISIEGYENSSAKLLPKETILFTIFATIGKVGILDIEATTNQAIVGIFSENGIDNKYLFQLLRYTGFTLYNKSHGIAQNNINTTIAKQLQIALPPLPEQHRIVTKLEALQEQVNTSKDHLAKVPPLIKRFRQSVLAAACSGRLTEDWRREHPDVEPASELLKHIREERIRKYEEECRKTKAEGKKKPKKPTNLELPEVDTENLPKLPEGWMWTDIFAVSINHDGKRIPVKDKDRQKMEGEFPYYGASGIIDYVNGYLFDGDYLLIGEDGANLVSRSTPIAFKASGKFWVNNHAHVIEIEGGIPIELVEGYINGIDLIPYITGSAQPKLTQKKLNTIPIPLPPLYEQQVIVERIEKLFHFAEEVEKRVSKTTTLIDHLTQSIFSKAVRGELAPQDPNDEPATVLLERIKKERAKIEKEKKAQKRKSKTLLDFN